MSRWWDVGQTGTCPAMSAMSRWWDAGTAFIECQSGGSVSRLRAKEGESSTLSSFIECLTKRLNRARRQNEKE